MKKNILLASMMAFVMLLASCSKDIDDTRIIGKWSNTSKTYIDDHENQYFDRAGYYTFEFKKNGKGVYTFTYGSLVDEHKFSYSLIGSDLKIACSTQESINQTYSVKEISDNHLVFEGECRSESFQPGAIYHWDLKKQ